MNWLIKLWAKRNNFEIVEYNQNYVRLERNAKNSEMVLILDLKYLNVGGSVSGTDADCDSLEKLACNLEYTINNNFLSYVGV